MPILNIKIGQQDFDLYAISNASQYNELDAQPKEARKKAAQYLVGFMDPAELNEVIAHLAGQCFEARGPRFIREGAESFLGDILKAYVNKYDGPALVAAYQGRQMDGFKFTGPSASLFQRLQAIARDKSTSKGDPNYLEYLASNLSNKLWQPIISDWLTQDLDPEKPTPEQLQLAGNVARNLQTFASNTQLLTNILNNNIDPQSAAPITEDFAAVLRTPGEAIKAIKATLANIHDAKTQEKIHALIKEVEKLGLEQAIPMDELAAVIDETNSLLTKQTSLEEFQAKCKLMEGAGSKIYTALSFLMLAVSVAAITAGIVLVSTATAGIAPAVAAGVAAGAAAAAKGFFNAGQSQGLAKAAEDVADAQQQARQPDDDHPSDDFILEGPNY